MRFQVTQPDITSISVGDESHAVVNGIVEVPTTDEARAALQVLVERGVLVGLPDTAEPPAPQAPTEPPSPPAPSSPSDEKKSKPK